MPCITDQSTVDMIAREYCGKCKRNEEQAMLAVGYSASYARGGRGHEMVYANERVKQAIARIDAVQAQIGHRTVENLDSMYQQGFDVARTQRNPSGMATNVTGIARLYNMDQPEGKGDQPASITEEQAARWRAMADIATADSLSKPKLSTGA